MLPTGNFGARTGTGGGSRGDDAPVVTLEEGVRRPANKGDEDRRREHQQAEDDEGGQQP